ncbi:MAG: chemotaxis protein CheW [Bacteroidetes bacterium]|nr:chemotaxis protein CheW [Bacteroidota bacterium]
MNQLQKEIQEKSKNIELQEKFIVLQIENENFVIPLEYVSEIVKVKDVTEAPHQPEWVKGIMNLRDSVISLVDTRKRLGLKHTADEESMFVEKSKAAHLNWIKKLEEAVINNTAFSLTLDHTKCDFGKAAIHLLAKKDLDTRVRRKLLELEPTHHAVHNEGKIALELLKEGKKELALEKVEKIENEIVPEIIRYLDELNVIFQSKVKDIAVIIEYKGHHFAMLADDITKMKTFKPDNKQKGALTDNPFISGVFDDSEGLYQELNLKGVLTGQNDELLIETEQPLEE